MSSTALFVLLLFVVKHFVADGPMQIPYMYKNKGTYLHPGGLAHAGVHAAFTFWIAVVYTNFYVALFVTGIDFLIHYHVDWAKTKLTDNRGWATHLIGGGLQIESEWYFYALIMNQCLHFASYAVLTYIIL